MTRVRPRFGALLTLAALLSLGSFGPLALQPAEATLSSASASAALAEDPFATLACDLFQQCLASHSFEECKILAEYCTGIAF
jgi:hypothetical protein